MEYEKYILRECCFYLKIYSHSLRQVAHDFENGFCQQLVNDLVFYSQSLLQTVKKSFFPFTVERVA